MLTHSMILSFGKRFGIATLEMISEISYKKLREIDSLARQLFFVIDQNFDDIPI